MAVNWESIRSAYVSGKVSIKKLAAKYKVSEPALEKRAGREKWAEARRKMSETVISDADSKIAEIRVDELVAFNATDLRVAKALRQQVADHLDNARRGKKPIDAAQLRRLASASESAQRIGRLALGASTDNSSVTTKELPASVDEFV